MQRERERERGPKSPNIMLFPQRSYDLANKSKKKTSKHTFFFMVERMVKRLPYLVMRENK
jgi:hypothetical protein